MCLSNFIKGAKVLLTARQVEKILKMNKVFFFLNCLCGQNGDRQNKLFQIIYLFLQRCMFCAGPEIIIHISIKVTNGFLTRFLLIE